MVALLIVNDGPYQTERAYNAFRLAAALRKEPVAAEVRVFLLSEGVTCALPDQLRPEGQYNVEQQIRDLLAAGGEVRVCGNCVDHRGLFKLTLIEGVRIGSMPELAQWVAEADKVITF